MGRMWGVASTAAREGVDGAEHRRRVVWVWGRRRPRERAPVAEEVASANRLIPAVALTLGVQTTAHSPIGSTLPLEIKPGDE